MNLGVFAIAVGIVGLIALAILYAWVKHEKKHHRWSV